MPLKQCRYGECISLVLLSYLVCLWRVDSVVISHSCTKLVGDPVANSFRGRICRFARAGSSAAANGDLRLMWMQPNRNRGIFASSCVALLTQVQRLDEALAVRGWVCVGEMGPGVNPLKYTGEP